MQIQIHNNLIFSSYLDENEMLQKVRENAQSRKIPVISDDTGRFLEAVCFILKPAKILEIGCGTGYSTFFMLKNFKNLNPDQAVDEKNYCIKNNKKYVYTGIDLNKVRITEAENFIKEVFPELYGSDAASNLRNIRFLPGNAIHIIPKLDIKFDFVFIDAAKFEYPLYIKSLEGKLEKGAVIIADNIFYSKKIFNDDTGDHDKNSIAGLKEYINCVTENVSFQTGFFNISDGISVSIYKG